MYTEDGEFVGAGQHLVGRQALEDYLAGLPTSTRHRITCNHVIDVDRDRAVCTSSVLLLDGGAIVSTGRAVDELRRVDGRWHIARRIFDPDARRGISRVILSPHLMGEVGNGDRLAIAVDHLRPARDEFG